MLRGSKSFCSIKCWFWHVYEKCQNCPGQQVVNHVLALMKGGIVLAMKNVTYMTIYFIWFWNKAVDPTEPVVLPREYAMSQDTCSYTVLQFVCLGDKCHTEMELLAAFQSLAKRWLTSHYRQPGKIVCDKNTNLLAAFCQEKITRVSCLVHTLNLVIQRLCDCNTKTGPGELRFSSFRTYAAFWHPLKERIK